MRCRSLKLAILGSPLRSSRLFSATIHEVHGGSHFHARSTSMSGATCDDQEDGNLDSLFVCEEYVEKIWQFEDLQQPLLCSNMSSTDHDLTGQIVWPACVLLSWFVHRNKHNFSGRVVVELGAGCGLAGFVAAHYAKHCVITDGNDIVCSLLQRNREHLNSRNVSIQNLLWGVKDEVERCVSAVGVFPDVIIGADVILWPNQISQLLYTVRWFLLGKKDTAVCYISYIVRASTTTERLFATAKQLGLAIETEPTENFVPAECRDFDGLQKMLLRISVAEGADVEKLLAEEARELTAQDRQREVLARPC
jgi:predicted nicotinamide N-methyase